MADLLQFHKQRLDGLRADRSSFDAQWEEAAARVMPQDRSTFHSQGSPTTQGQKKTEFQFDATAALAAHRFSAVLESIMVPKNSIWQRLVTHDKMLRRNRRVREYYEDATNALFRYRYAPGSGFVTNMQQVFLSEGVYGNGSIYIDAPETGPRGLRYRAIHLSEAYFVQNHAGIVDTMYRPFTLTALQAVEQFGELVPAQIKDALKNPNQQNQKFKFLHVCGPNADYVPGMIGAQGRPFYSVYLSIEPDGMVVRGGYTTFPYGVWRYTQAVGEVYGRGPAQWVLPAIKLLNEQKKTVLKQGHRTVDPVLLSHDDGTLDGFVLRSGYLNKGGMTADGKPLVGVLPTGRVDVGEKMMEMERQVINDAFLISLFQILVENPQMTATEVMERMKEKGMLLAPTAGRGEEELLGPMTDRELDVLSSQGLLPEMPAILRDALGDAEYAIEWDSPLARMRRAEGAAGFMRVINTAAEYAKMTGDIAPMDHIAFDRAMPELIDINGVPLAWTATEDEVAAKREERNKAAEMKQMSDAAPGMAALAKAMPQAANAAGAA